MSPKPQFPPGWTTCRHICLAEWPSVQAKVCVGGEGSGGTVATGAGTGAPRSRSLLCCGRRPPSYNLVLPAFLLPVCPSQLRNKHTRPQIKLDLRFQVIEQLPGRGEFSKDRTHHSHTYYMWFFKILAFIFPVYGMALRDLNFLMKHHTFARSRCIWNPTV